MIQTASCNWAKVYFKYLKSLSISTKDTNDQQVRFKCYLVLIRYLFINYM